LTPSNKGFIDQALKDRGDDWVIAAMVDGSIGYYSPHSAMLQVQRYREGETRSWCERGDALFNGDLLEEMSHDIRGLERKEETNPEGVKKLVGWVAKAKEIDSFEFNATVSMMYPTSAPV
jgi:hypothetical protein